MTLLLRDSKTMRNLVGEKIGNLTVETCLSNGPFAQVYKTKNTATGLTSAFKVAQSNSVTTSSRPTPDQSQALEEITGAVMQVRPDPLALLHYQASFTQSIGNEVFPKFFSFIEETDRQLVGYEMEFIDGVTLRDLIAEHAATLSHIVLIAEALEKLLSCAPYHGDLKPSNIIIDESTVKLLDPGFFGEIKSGLGDSFPMKVTTPLYYPFLNPDDFFAVGLITWEAVFGRHPLKYTEFADADISDQLDMVVRKQGNRGTILSIAAPEVTDSSPSDAAIGPRGTKHLAQVITIVRDRRGKTGRRPWVPEHLRNCGGTERVKKPSRLLSMGLVADVRVLTLRFIGRFESSSQSSFCDISNQVYFHRFFYSQLLIVSRGISNARYFSIDFYIEVLITIS
ncbi:MAG: hypothetical protein K2X93_14105 [Candidatus Obscuribacterales bacterium]|nr:hypothetical protein [Candidatus Obscuribacterales bacterium]